MLVSVHFHTEGLFYLRNRSRERYGQAVGGFATHLEAVGAGEVKDLLIVICRGPKLISEFLYGEKVMIVRARRVVEAVQKTVKLGLVAQWKNNRQVHALRGGKLAQRFGLTARYGSGHVVQQDML